MVHMSSNISHFFSIKRIYVVLKKIFEPCKYTKVIPFDPIIAVLFLFPVIILQRYQNFVLTDPFELLSIVQQTLKIYGLDFFSFCRI
jgi:hypothetical protein